MSSDTAATPAAATPAAATPATTGEAKKEAKPKRPCAFKGCTNPGSKGCGGCGEVAYCGKEHQLADWTEHKLVCKKKHQTAEAKKVNPATGVAGMSAADLVALMPPSKNEPVVTFEDQKKINKFGKASARFQDLTEDIKAKAVEEENLGDAIDALDEVDSDEEDAIRVRVGEVYITTTKKEALKRVKDARKTVKKEHEDRRKEQNALKDEMDPLKVELKKKFGDSINLEFTKSD